MNEEARRILGKLIVNPKYGRSLGNDPHRCEGLLRDLCGQYRKEISALVSAVKEGITREIEILLSDKPVSPEILLETLTQRLQENSALSAEAARWSVESWALALGVIDNHTLNEYIVLQNTEIIPSTSIFLDEFFFLDSEDALPGALLPNIPGNLKFKGHKITPLIPLKPDILKYFTPEDLIGTENQPGKLKFEAINNGKGVRISIDTSPRFPSPQPKEYNLKNVRHQIPMIELWPNSISEKWKKYHALYYQVSDSDRNTFQVKFSATTQNSRTEYTYERRAYQLIELNKFPSCIECFEAGNLLGIILLKTPEITEKDAKSLRLKVTDIEKPENALDFFECYMHYHSISPYPHPINYSETTI